MISKQKEAEILRYAHAEKWRVNTIAQQLGVHNSVVTRVLEQNGLPRAERQGGPSILDDYLPLILETLQQFPDLPASRLYAMAVERGYHGGPSHFRSRVSELRPRPIPEAYLRLQTLPGEQGQIDWGLCRARHKPHYADSLTMPSYCSICV
jgi:transposase